MLTLDIVFIYHDVQSFRIWIRRVKQTDCEVPIEFRPAVTQHFASLGDAQSCSLSDKFRFLALVFAVFACLSFAVFACHYFCPTNTGCGFFEVHKICRTRGASLTSEEELGNGKGKALVLAILDYYISMCIVIFSSLQL
ncbi:hypothetical protein SORBI_3004G078750 [Sorghum bicolor]|jgi:hypothetical protein|uniref:Uncharacterized protein n=1 Tax=Sorghum bicolor TaxID=4558 RepID=A0A1Z5RLE8_SORBI|nr:hypothetical protein SORBI_3004G078750 [Sorghum bicolor]